MEGTSSSERLAALTCAGWNGLTRREPGAHASPLRRPREVSEGSIRRSRRQPTRLRSSPPPRASARAWAAGRPEAGNRAVKARGRWRPDDREVVRRRPWTNGGNAGVPGTSSKPSAGGFSHGTRRAVSEGGVSSWVLVTRNVGCRSDFEASWRCDQETPQGITRRNVEATEKVDGPDGAGGHSPRRRVLRACKGRKAGAGPSVMESSKPVGPRSSFIEIAEGAWGLEVRER